MILFFLGVIVGFALALVLHFRKTILPDAEDFRHPLASLAEAWSEVKAFILGDG